MRFEMFDMAIEETLSLIRTVRGFSMQLLVGSADATLQSDRRLAQEPLTMSGTTWLPYTLIDQLLVATADQRGVSPQATRLRKELHIALSNRMQRMQKASSQLY
jgi:hypothetical protein